MVNKNKCISREKISEELFYIKGSLNYFITKNIEIYKYYPKYGYYKMKQHINNKNGYVYCAVKYNKHYELATERVHRIVALTFIHNNDKERKLMVGHKDNIKHHNNIDNLYWTTNQENTKKAVDDGLNTQPTGINSVSKSYPILVTDLENNVVAVYGGIREAGRMIDNVSESYVQKTARDFGEDYKPRSKRYKYFKISKEEYLNYSDTYKNKRLTEIETLKKQCRLFKAINLLTGEEFISDNQKQFARDHSLKQASISQALINNRPYENWEFEIIKDLNYLETSGYNSLIDIFDDITIKHIETNAELHFTNPKKLKDYFGMVGHDVKQYITRDNLIFSKWKIIKINNEYIN